MRFKIFIIFIYILIINVNLTISAERSLKWDMCTNQTGYNVYYGIHSGVYSNCINVGNVLYYNIINLEENTVYYFIVKSYDDNCESPPSNEVVWNTRNLNPPKNFRSVP